MYEACVNKITKITRSSRDILKEKLQKKLREKRFARA
jgi:hypothetical protein